MSLNRSQLFVVCIFNIYLKTWVAVHIPEYFRNQIICWEGSVLILHIYSHWFSLILRPFSALDWVTEYKAKIHKTYTSSKARKKANFVESASRFDEYWVACVTSYVISLCKWLIKQFFLSSYMKSWKNLTKHTR